MMSIITHHCIRSTTGILRSRTTYPLRIGKYSPIIITRNVSFVESANNAAESLAKVDQTIRHCAPSQSVQECLNFIHDLSCTSWSSSILLYCLAARIIILLPLSYYQEILRRKMMKVLIPEIEKLGLRKKQELENDLKNTLYKTPEILSDLRKKYMREFKNERSKLYLDLNLHPSKPIVLGLSQMPYWLFSSAAIRNFSYDYDDSDFINVFQHNQLKYDGTFWFADLTLPDPYLVLPMVFGISSLLAIRIYKMGLPAKRTTRMQRWSFGAMQAIAVCITLRAAISPSALSLFLSFSTLLHTIQLSIIRRDEIMQMLGKGKLKENEKFQEIKQIK